MVKRKPYRACADRLAHYATPRHLLWYVAAPMSAGALCAFISWQTPGKSASLPTSVSGNAPSVSGSSDTANTLSTSFTVLSAQDIAHYKTIFDAQKSEKWQEADAEADKLDSPVLLGHVLAQRYLSHGYHSSADELLHWLDTYADHPEAKALFALASRHYPALKASIRAPQTQILTAVSADSQPGYLEDTDYAKQWNEGLQAWKKGNKSDAARFFSSIARHSDELSPSAASTAAYWAWRAYNAVGNPADADHYLRMAAVNPRSFYGILARRQLKQELQLDSQPAQFSRNDMNALVQNPLVKRVIALSETGQTDLAEQELRDIFPQAATHEKHMLLALAHKLNLASVQISMASQLGDEDHALDFAQYPVPSWEPAGGFTVDPALLFALMRQESGFYPEAVSPGGALGLMQLMPRTVSFMQKDLSQKDQSVSQLSGPVLNITLGQNYVHQLLDTNLVEGNLFYLLTAYNAGPGRLQEWKQQASHKDDPLLFLETIPYAQTRHYVSQVMTNYWIYSELTGRKNASLSALLHNSWPVYDETILPVAANATDSNS